MVVLKGVRTRVLCLLVEEVLSRFTMLIEDFYKESVMAI